MISNQQEVCIGYLFHPEHWKIGAIVSDPSRHCAYRTLLIQGGRPCLSTS